MSLAYEELLAQAKSAKVPADVFLKSALPDLWLPAYYAMTPRPSNVMIVTSGSFDYVFDHYTLLEETGEVEPDDVSESRLVAAIGTSCVNTSKRDDGRLRGWVGPTDAVFGGTWDKGHFIAHSIGGAVDGLELNVFRQKRSINRGAYRRLEKYCSAHPGTLCFSRPIYSDPTACPAYVEFGVLKSDGHLTVAVFDNR